MLCLEKGVFCYLVFLHILDRLLDTWRRLLYLSSYSARRVEFDVNSYDRQLYYGVYQLDTGFFPKAAWKTFFLPYKLRHSTVHNINIKVQWEYNNNWIPNFLLVPSIICIYNIFYLRISRNLRIAHEKNKTADNKGYGKANGCKNTNSNIIPFHYLIFKIDRGFKINHICTDTCQLVLSNYSLKLP